MTVANINVKDIFKGNALTKTWPISFSLNGVTDEEVLVYLTTLSTGVSILLDSNYSVDLNAATVTYPVVGSAILPSYGIVIRRKLALTQETDLVNQGSIPAETLEQSFDRFAMICQQMQEQLDRTAQSDVSGSSADSEIGVLLTSVSDARDEATLAAASASTSADILYASMAVASAYINTLNTSFSAAAAYADSAGVSADAAAASANAAAASAVTITAALDTDVSLTANSDSKIATQRATKTYVGTKTAFGSPVSKSVNTVYQAATDGFVSYCATLVSGDQVVLLTDSLNPPTTNTQQLTYNTSSSLRGNIFYPIKKNDYYKINISAGSPTLIAFNFIPFGA